MPKYEFNIEMVVEGEPSDIKAVAVYDHTIYNSQVYPEHFIEIYEVYMLVGLDRPNIYLDGVLTKDQYAALEQAILEGYE